MIARGIAAAHAHRQQAAATAIQARARGWKARRTVSSIRAEQREQAAARRRALAEERHAKAMRRAARTTDGAVAHAEAVRSNDRHMGAVQERATAKQGHKAVRRLSNTMERQRSIEQRRAEAAVTVQRVVRGRRGRQRVRAMRMAAAATGDSSDG